MATVKSSCLISYTKLFPWRADSREYAVDRIISLDEDVITVGWAPNADYTLDSPILSRIHSVFTKWNGVWHVKDNNSENGVYVNGVKLVAREQTPLQDGYSVCFGEKTPDEELFFTFTETTGFSGGDKLKKENERLEKEVEHFRNELMKQERINCQANERERVRALLEQKPIQRRKRVKIDNIQLQKSMDDMKGQVDRTAQRLKNVSRELEIHKRQSDYLDIELRCCLCSELLMMAVVLNCSHSICSYCVREKSECPVCRTKITSQTRSQVLDSIVECRVDTWSSQKKTRRKQLLQTRLVHQDED